MKKPVKRVAAIHDLCGIGKAALTNIIPVLSTMGFEVCPIPTMILTTHTGGFTPNIVKLDGYITKAVEHYKDINMDFEGIFIGYLGNETNILETISFLELIRNNNSLIVFDPIFADNGKYYSNFDKNYSNKMRQVIKYSHIITPNYTEACILADENIKEKVDDDELLIVFKKLQKLGCENIIITSVPINGAKKIGTAVYNGKNNSMKIIIKDKLEKSYPGTGDVFTSVLIGMLLMENSLIESAQKACDFIESCIALSSQYDYPTKEGLLLERTLKLLID